MHYKNGKNKVLNKIVQNDNKILESKNFNFKSLMNKKLLNLKRFYLLNTYSKSFILHYLFYHIFFIICH